MSTANPPPAAPVPSALPEPRPLPSREILIIGHSTLLYWWPVWAIGFLFALFTFFTGDLVALVPNSTKKDQDLLKNASGSATVETVKGQGITEKREVTFEKQDVLIAPKPQNPKHAPLPIDLTPVHISTSKHVGVFFVLLLLVIIVVTNVPLRGPWSVIVVLFVVALVILLAYLGVLEQVLNVFSWLDVRISLGGYVAISVTLFVLWLLVVMVFDRFNYYMVFKPGQLKVREGFWEGEKDYDTAGMTLEKQRTDLFRHWILGLGAGDLIIRTSGAQGHQHDFPNVLFVSRRAAEINEMMRERAVVSGQNV